MDDGIDKVIEEETFPMKFFDRVLGIFFAPGKVLANVKEYPKIGAAVFMAIVFAGLGGLYARQTAEIALEEQQLIYLERYGAGYLDLNEAIQSYASNETLATVTTIGTLVVTPFIAAFLASLIVFIITKAFRGYARFGQYYAMFFHIYIVTGLLNLIPTLFIVMNHSTTNVLSLGVLMPGGNVTSPLYNILSAVTLAGLWEAVLVCVGVKIINEWKFAKSFFAALVYYVIWAAGAAAIQIGGLMVTDWSFNMMNSISF